MLLHKFISAATVLCVHNCKKNNAKLIFFFALFFFLTNYSCSRFFSSWQTIAVRAFQKSPFALPLSAPVPYTWILCWGFDLNWPLTFLYLQNRTFLCVFLGSSRLTTRSQNCENSVSPPLTRFCIRTIYLVCVKKNYLGFDLLFKLGSGLAQSFFWFLI